MPFLAWLVSGSLKFAVNYLRAGKQAKELIGYGGFPSTHTAILSSAVFLYGFEEGFATAGFSMGLAIMLVTAIDAHGMRRKIGEQAAEINKLKAAGGEREKLRERMGHSWLEILGGAALGLLLAFFAESVF
jgi:acid phosphatase family membrane protein YuiD